MYYTELLRDRLLPPDDAEETVCGTGCAQGERGEEGVVVNWTTSSPKVNRLGGSQEFTLVVGDVVCFFVDGVHCE